MGKRCKEGLQGDALLCLELHIPPSPCQAAPRAAAQRKAQRTTAAAAQAGAAEHRAHKRDPLSPPLLAGAHRRPLLPTLLDVLKVLVVH